MIEILDNIVAVEMILLGMCIIMQPSKARAIIAVIFSGTILLHNEFFMYFSDSPEMYYLSDGLISLCVIFIIANLKHIPKLAIDIQQISFISILYNLAGIILYWAGYGPIIYVSMYAVLYGWAVFKLTRGEPDGCRDYKMDTWISAFRYDAPCSSNPD